MPVNPNLLCNYNSPIKNNKIKNKKEFTLGCLLTHMIFLLMELHISFTFQLLMPVRDFRSKVFKTTTNSCFYCNTSITIIHG